MNMTNDRKMELMARPDPCTGCHNNTKCQFELLACRAFQHYVYSGYTGKNIARLPTRKIFNDIFFEDNPMTMRQLREQLRREEI